MSTDAYDTIVVGAGLGGLIAGAKLSREGHTVLVLEQHSIVGGCATIFNRPDFTFEVSLHEIEGLDEYDIKRPIFEELGVLDALTFEPIPEFYNYCRGDDELVVPHGRCNVSIRPKLGRFGGTTRSSPAATTSYSIGQMASSTPRPTTRSPHRFPYEHLIPWRTRSQRPHRQPWHSCTGSWPVDRLRW